MWESIQTILEFQLKQLDQPVFCRPNRVFTFKKSIPISKSFLGEFWKGKKFIVLMWFSLPSSDVSLLTSPQLRHKQLITTHHRKHPVCEKAAIPVNHVDMKILLRVWLKEMALRSEYITNLAELSFQMSLCWWSKEVCQSKVVMCPQCDTGCRVWELADTCTYAKVSFWFLYFNGWYILIIDYYY